MKQVTARAPFTVDFIVRPSDGGANARPTRSAIPSSAVTNWLSTGTRLFSERFRDTFSLKEKGFNDEDVTAAKSALSNMLGGMGYFTGRSKIKHAGAGSGDDSGGDRGREVDDGFSFETSLFTAVPSRSFFPRGFLWDEGFHQVCVAVLFPSVKSMYRQIRTAGASSKLSRSIAHNFYKLAFYIDFCHIPRPLCFTTVLYVKFRLAVMYHISGAFRLFL